MAVRINLSVGDDLDRWISEKAEQIGIAKNAYVIMCVANTRNQEENMKMMGNIDMINALNKMVDLESHEKEVSE